MNDLVAKMSLLHEFFSRKVFVLEDLYDEILN